MADRSISYEFRGRFENLQAGLSAANRSVRDFGTNLTGLDRRGAEMRRGLDQLGGTAGRAGLALGAGFVAAAASAANFEQRMSFVQAATHETAANMGLLQKAALDAGQATVFSATEAAGAIEELAKAGISTKDILGGGLTGALDLAAAGGIEVAAAAEAAASAMTQFKLSGQDVPHIADLLAAGAGKAQGSVADMSAALNQSGLVASQTGLTIEEATGTLAAFASAGLTGSDAGTSFKTMLQSLTPTSDAAREKMDQLGISAYDAQGNFVGMTKFADSLSKGLQGLSVEQQNAAMKTIFGADAVRAASVVFQQGAGGIKSWIDETNDAGYASETAAIRMDNLKGDVEQLGGALETLMIGGGQGQGGLLRDLTQSATEFVNVLNGLPGPVKSTSTALVGLAAITAGGFWFTAKAVSAMVSTRVAMQALGFQAATTRQALMTLAAGGAALSVATFAGLDVLGRTDTWQRGREAADATAKSYDDLAEVLKKSNVGKFADDLGIDMGRLAEDLYRNGESGEYAQKVLADLADTTDGFGNGLKGVAGDIIPGWTSATNKAYEANKDLGNILEHNKGVLGSAEQDAKNAALAQTDLSGASLDLAKSSNMSAEDIQALDQAMKKAGETAEGASSSFLDLSAGMKDGKFSFSDWIAELEHAGNAVANFRKNADKALDRGIPQGLVTSLEEMGAAGAVQLDHLANATPAQMRRIIAAWKRWERQSDATTDAITDDLTGVGAGVDDVDSKVARLGKRKAKPTAELRADAFEAKHRRIEADLRGLSGKKANPKVDADKKTFDLKLGNIRTGLAGLDRQFVAPTIGIDDRATGVIASIKSALSTVRDKIVHITTVATGGSADGGTVPKTGLPYADRHPYLLADGEEVISNRFGQADRHRDLLKAINAGRLANGGTVGLADGGTARRLPGIGFADLPSLNLAAMGLKALTHALHQSEKALEKEKDQRQAVVDKMQSLRSDVTGNLRSDVFGAEQNIWTSAGATGSFSAVMAGLAGDTSRANGLRGDLKTLKHKGLDKDALAELARQDPAIVDQWARLSKAQLAQFERAFANRQSAVSATGRFAGEAAYGGELKIDRRQIGKLEDRLKQIDHTLKVEHRSDRNSTRKGASAAHRNRRKD